MAVDGSRWQFLGRSPISIAPRDASDNECSGWLTMPSSHSTTRWSTVLLCRRGRPIRGKPERRRNQPENYFPILISTDYTLVTLVPTLLRGNAVLAVLRLARAKRPGRYSGLFQNRALRSAFPMLHKRRARTARHGRFDALRRRQSRRSRIGCAHFNPCG